MMQNTDKSYTVLITASGAGEALGDITRYINKTLIKVGKKPTLSYIVEAYPPDTEYVVTLGHFAEQVKEFIQLVYPDRKFSFVEVDKYEGEGSSLAYSMLRAKDLLQIPFIYHASDTIVSDNIPYPEDNWIGGHQGEGSSHYSSFDIVDDGVQQVYGKGRLKADYLHIGLVGINDYKNFWDKLEMLYKNNPLDRTLGDIHAINEMIKSGTKFQVDEYPQWHDVGSIDSLQRTRSEIDDSFHILDKLEESIYLFEKFVVKFFNDAKIVEQRVKRANILDGLVPPLEQGGNNFYKYTYVEGDLYAHAANKSNFQDFLHWSEDNLWKPVNEVSKKKFKDICYNFYYKKTIDRIDQFLKTRAVKDTKNIINGLEVPPVHEILKKIDFDWLCASEQVGFHGDFILDNIIKTSLGYKLLDWRHNFGGLLEAGDKYYDLAKLNHNLTVNHDIINDNMFDIQISGEKVSCDIMRRQTLIECQNELDTFLKDNDYDIKRVKILTPIVWLNMSPLHHHPLDLFLFYFGKYNLWQAIN